MEQRAVCEDGGASNGGGVSGVGRGDGEEPEMALEQECTTIDWKCEADAARAWAQVVLKVPPKNRCSTIGCSACGDEEERQVGENRNGCCQEPVLSTTTAL